MDYRFVAFADVSVCTYIVIVLMAKIFHNAMFPFYELFESYPLFVSSMFNTTAVVNSNILVKLMATSLALSEIFPRLLVNTLSDIGVDQNVDLPVKPLLLNDYKNCLGVYCN